MATTDVMRLPSAGHGRGGDRFNYKGMHRYIITQPVKGEIATFSVPEPVFAVLHALRASASEHRFDVYAYCFLPNRLLLLVRGKDEESDMKAFLSAFRIGSSAALEPVLGHPLWAGKYTERVLRKTEETRNIARELFMTPVKEGLAASPQKYAFLGSFTVETAAILTLPGWEKRRGPSRNGPFKGSVRRNGKPSKAWGKPPSGPTGSPPASGSFTSDTGVPADSETLSPGFGNRPPRRRKPRQQRRKS